MNIHWHLGAEHRMENAYGRRSPEWATVAHQRVTIEISVEKASYVTVPDENHVSQPVVPGLWCPHEAVHVFGF